MVSYILHMLYQDFIRWKQANFFHFVWNFASFCLGGTASLEKWGRGDRLIQLH